MYTRAFPSTNAINLEPTTLSGDIMWLYMKICRHYSSTNFIKLKCNSVLLFAQVTLHEPGNMISTMMMFPFVNVSLHRSSEIQHIRGCGPILQHIVALQSHMTSGTLVRIGSVNCLAPNRRQVIALTSDTLLSIRPPYKESDWFESTYKYLHQLNILQNIVCEMTSILFRPQYVCGAAELVSSEYQVRFIS